MLYVVWGDSDEYTGQNGAAKDMNNELPVQAFSMAT